MDDKSALGRRVRRCREACHLTREDLAACSGVAASTIRNVESGRHLPTRSTMEKIWAVPEMVEALRLLHPEAAPRPVLLRHSASEEETARVHRALRLDDDLWRMLPLVGYRADPEGLCEDRQCPSCARSIERPIKLQRALAAFAQRVEQLEQDAQTLAKPSVLQAAAAETVRAPLTACLNDLRSGVQKAVSLNIAWYRAWQSRNTSAAQQARLELGRALESQIRALDRAELWLRLLCGPALKPEWAAVLLREAVDRVLGMLGAVAAQPGVYRVAGQSQPIEVRIPADLTLHADPLLLDETLYTLIDHVLQRGGVPLAIAATPFSAPGNLDPMQSVAPFALLTLSGTDSESPSRSQQQGTEPLSSSLKAADDALELPLCKSLCELHGGRMWIEAPPGICVKLLWPITAYSCV